MKRFCIKCREGRLDYFDIINENDEGYSIRITRVSDGNQKTVEEYMSKYLFDICVQTGYIYEQEKASASVA
jgi:hypothetical protein